IHIIPDLTKGGAERLAITICNALALQDNIDVRLITFTSKNEYGNLISNDIWTVIPASYVPSLSKKPQLHITELQTYINDFAPHVIHTHLWKAEMVSRQIQYPNAQWFSHVHDNMPQLKKPKLPFTKKSITNWYERSLMIPKYAETNTKFIAISH